VLRAAVPEAAITEDGDARAGEDDVRTYPDTFDAKEDILAEAKTAPVKPRPQRDLRLRVGVSV
jgi:hypothetical protein